MKSQQQEFQKTELKNQAETGKNRFIIGSIIATFIAVTPLLFNLHESVPDAKSWDTFFGTYTSLYYQSTLIFAWTLTGKLIPLFLLFIWFFTCRHWWFHAILVPICMYIYQTLVVLNDDLYFADTNHSIYIIIVMAIIIPTIYLVRARIFKKINETTKSMQELEDEFKLSPKNIWQRLKLYF
jgi:hypothetical protein